MPQTIAREAIDVLVEGRRDIEQKRFTLTRLGTVLCKRYSTVELERRMDWLIQHSYARDNGDGTYSFTQEGYLLAEPQLDG